jgi:hypothetical protein
LEITHLVSNKQKFILKNTLKEDIKEYQIMHDCGKPYCITIDEDGRRHFPPYKRIKRYIL